MIRDVTVPLNEILSKCWKKNSGWQRANEGYNRNTRGVHTRGDMPENIWPWWLARAYLLIPGKYWEFNQPVINTRI